MTGKSVRHASFAFLAALIVLAACRHEPPAAQAQTAPESESNQLIRLAGVERIEVVILESYPVQVRVVVYGWLSDGCTKLHGFDQKTEGKVIAMRVLTTRPRDAICTQAIKRFQETYPVETEGLAPGTYTLDVNGKSKQITLP
jgi:inhibitor of cysteine peptidase